MTHADPEVRAAYRREYRSSHPDRRNYASRADNINQRRARARALINEAKDGPCVDCGVRYPPYVMDFDHVRGTKHRNLSAGSMLTSSEAKIREEIAKCDLVCSNCHRERTHGERR